MNHFHFNKVREMSNLDPVSEKLVSVSHPREISNYKKEKWMRKAEKRSAVVVGILDQLSPYSIKQDSKIQTSLLYES